MIFFSPILTPASLSVKILANESRTRFKACTDLVKAVSFKQPYRCCSNFGRIVNSTVKDIQEVEEVEYKTNFVHRVPMIKLLRDNGKMFIDLHFYDNLFYHEQVLKRYQESI